MDLSQYKVGIVLSVEECGKNKSGKVLKACKVNVGDEENPLTIVTVAPNVREASRLVIAPEGSTIINEEGEEMQVKKTSVGGVMSEGMFCDSRMLGWSGGAAGVAAQIPDSFELGSAPPTSKPRPQDAAASESSTIPQVEVKGLFEKKLTKEEKKKLAEERKKARAAKKAAKKQAEEKE